MRAQLILSCSRLHFQHLEQSQWSRLQACNERGVERFLVGELRLFEPEIRQVMSRRELTEEEGEEEKGPGK